MKLNRYDFFLLLGIALMLGAVLWATANAQDVGRTARLTWAAATQYEDGSTIAEIVTYNVYAGPRGGTKTKIPEGQGVPTLSYNAINLPPGETCFHITTSTPKGGESVASPEACKSFPYPRPKAPASLTVS